MRVYVCAYIHVHACMYACVSVCMHVSVCSSVCLFACLRTCLFVICLSVRLSVCLSIFPSIGLTVYSSHISIFLHSNPLNFCFLFLPLFSLSLPSFIPPSILPSSHRIVCQSMVCVRGEALIVVKCFPRHSISAHLDGVVYLPSGRETT